LVSSEKTVSEDIGRLSKDESTSTCIIVSNMIKLQSKSSIPVFLVDVQAKRKTSKIKENPTRIFLGQ
jgi:hypothetical protein